MQQAVRFKSVLCYLFLFYFIFIISTVYVPQKSCMNQLISLACILYNCSITHSPFFSYFSDHLKGILLQNVKQIHNFLQKHIFMSFSDRIGSVYVLVPQNNGFEEREKMLGNWQLLDLKGWSPLKLSRWKSFFFQLLSMSGHKTFFKGVQKLFLFFVYEKRTMKMTQKISFSLRQNLIIFCQNNPCSHRRLSSCQTFQTSFHHSNILINLFTIGPLSHEENFKIN